MSRRRRTRNTSRTRNTPRAQTTCLRPRVRAHTSVLPMRLLASDALMRLCGGSTIRPTSAALAEVEALPAGESPDPMLLNALLTHPDERVIVATLEKVGVGVSQAALLVLLRRMELANEHDGTVWCPLHVAVAKLADCREGDADTINRLTAVAVALHQPFAGALRLMSAEETRQAAQLVATGLTAQCLTGLTPHPEALFDVPSFADWLRLVWPALVPDHAAGASVDHFKALLPRLAEVLSAPLAADSIASVFALSDLALLDRELRAIKDSVDPSCPMLEDVLDAETLTTLVEQIVDSDALAGGQSEPDTQSLLDILNRYQLARAGSPLRLTPEFMLAVQGAPWDGVRETGATLAQYV